ncbi:glycosyltransferase family 2 protein [Acidipropionibacterium acidipropionici]|uniref:glycosyltransferase family 2 protein n=1 Tax=Acidipropionibacterium acidipropionici TaxID=1748 RepID=UPI00110B86C1|nr:glycosyltransferase family 2 protein [Acidipropionibacterium acidipropionici]QCV96048.1 glycosyltransferase [Acidipropionibacterium acidipropionici]
MTTASVIIPSFRGAGRLPRLLSCLAAQTSTDWEAIVVIDGDIDGSEQVVERYKHLPVRSIVFPQNRGRVVALNAGFEAAKGDVLIRCDDDFEPGPAHIAGHLAAHADHECGVVGVARAAAHENTYMRIYGHDADERGSTAAYATPPEQRWRLWGGNVSCSREAFSKIGGYDPRYRQYGWEDLDFGYRLAQAAIPIEISPAIEVPHAMASVTTRTRVSRAFLSGRARHLFDEIHGAGASGPVTPEKPTAWDRSVTALADRLTYRRSAALAQVEDLAIRSLPTPVARKLVALLVEASGIAGYRTAEEVPNDI